MKLVLQLGLGAFESIALGFGQLAAGAVDVESQHRKRRSIGARLAARTALGRTLERRGDLLRIGQAEDPVLQIERVALLGDALRPSFRRLPGAGLPGSGFARWRGATMSSHVNSMSLMPERTPA